MDIIKTFESVSGQKLNYIVGERRNGDVESLYADAAKANNLLGWSAQLSIEDSFHDTWNWEQYLKK